MHGINPSVHGSVSERERIYSVHAVFVKRSAPLCYPLQQQLKKHICYLGCHSLKHPFYTKAKTVILSEAKNLLDFTGQ